MSKQLTRDDIFSAKDVEIEKVEVPEWGGHVFIKGMTAASRGAIEAAISTTRGKGAQSNIAQIRERIAAASVCDKDGALLFTQKDIKELGERSVAALDKIVEAATRLSAISQDDFDELAKEMEENPLEDSASD